jgi:nucleoside-triphosphatase THEP1
MLHKSVGISETGKNVFPFKPGVAFQDCLHGISRSHHAQNMFDSQSVTLPEGLTPILAFRGWAFHNGGMIILLTGQKGSGKSTTVQDLATQLAGAGLRPGGVICPGIFGQGRKTGILARQLRSGAEALLGYEATMTGSPVPVSTGPDTFSYGRWEFRRSVMAGADAAVLQDMDDSRFVIVDEIGPLELDHGMGMSRTLARLDAGSFAGSCRIVVCARQDLAGQLTERWPGCALVELDGRDPDRSDRTIQKLLELLGV